MKPVSNTRTKRGTTTSWHIRRIVGSCWHETSVTYSQSDAANVRMAAARQLKAARRSIYLACDQQRETIRASRQYWL